MAKFADCPELDLVCAAYPKRMNGKPFFYLSRYGLSDRPEDPDLPESKWLGGNVPEPFVSVFRDISQCIICMEAFPGMSSCGQCGSPSCYRCLGRSAAIESEEKLAQNLLENGGLYGRRCGACRSLRRNNTGYWGVEREFLPTGQWRMDVTELHRRMREVSSMTPEEYVQMFRGSDMGEILGRMGLE